MCSPSGESARTLPGGADTGELSLQTASDDIAGQRSTGRAIFSADQVVRTPGTWLPFGWNTGTRTSGCSTPIVSAFLRRRPALSPFVAAPCRAASLSGAYKTWKDL
jgi:hypothetical protein